MVAQRWVIWEGQRGAPCDKRRREHKPLSVARAERHGGQCHIVRLGCKQVQGAESPIGCPCGDLGRLLPCTALSIMPGNAAIHYHADKHSLSPDKRQQRRARRPISSLIQAQQLYPNKAKCQHQLRSQPAPNRADVHGCRVSQTPHQSATQ